MDAFLLLSTIIGVILIALEMVQTHGHVPKLNDYDAERDTIIKQRLKDRAGA
jgi:hypothetical protein